MKRTIGAFEKVSFPDFGLMNVIAKVDTGALTGALHATEITETTTTEGDKIISFMPFGRQPAVETRYFRRKIVRSSNGAITKRYVIPTTIKIKGELYPINISLADRSSMMKGILLGRRFLRKHGFIVDPKKGSKYRYEVK